MLHGLRNEKGDPYEGIKIEFVNPVTGEPVFKTLDYSAQLLRREEETELKRETAGTYYVVIEGSGATEVGGKRFEWGHNDLFVVPNFLWRRHINTGKTDAVIYSVSDARCCATSGSTTRRVVRRTASPSWCNEGRAPRRKLRAQASSATVLRRVPISGTATSTTSPGLSHTDGLRCTPAPVGVPVQIRSPGLRVAKVLM